MTPQHVTAPKTESGWRIESRAAALERFVERHQFWILAAWTVAYFAGTMLRARAKPFWYDEIETLLEARQQTFSAAMGALRSVDWTTPVSRFTFFLTHRLTGSGEIAFRLPVMMAFWVFCICLYLFARRRVGVLLALTAMLLPFASVYQGYSYEARPYAFLLAFSGIALLCWQWAVEGIQRPWSLVGLAAAIAAAIAYHYWAVLIYLPLAAAEAYRSARARRVDWPIWGAFAAGGISLAAFLPQIFNAVNGRHSQSGMRVHLHSYLSTYAVAFRAAFAFLLPAALLLAVCWLLRGSKHETEGARRTSIPGHEWIAAVLLLLLPAIAVSIALIVPPHLYSPRYAAPAVAGFAFVIAFVGARLAEKRAAVGLACVIAALAPFLYLMSTSGHFANPVNRMPGLRRNLKMEPVFYEQRVPYLKLWYYMPTALRSNFICVCASESGAGGAASRGEFREMGIPFERPSEVIHPGADFLFYPSWPRKRQKLIRAIHAAGGSVEVVKRSKRRPLMRAHIPS